MSHPQLALPEWNDKNIWYMSKFMKLQPFIMTNTLYVVLHIPLVDKSPQFYLFRIHNMPLVHPIIKKSFKYIIQEEYLTTRLDEQYNFFLLSTDIMTCQVSNGQFCCITSPLYTADTSNPSSYTYSFKLKTKLIILHTVSYKHKSGWSN